MVTLSPEQDLNGPLLTHFFSPSFPDSILPHYTDVFSNSVSGRYVPSEIFIKHKSDVTALVSDVHIFNWLAKPSPPVIIQFSSLISHPVSSPLIHNILSTGFSVSFSV